MKRILHVLGTPRAEGTQNLVLDWLAAGKSYWQGVVVLHSQPNDLTSSLRSAADLYEEHNLYRPGYGKYFQLARMGYQAVRRYRPDVIVCWPTGFANWICAGAFAAGCRGLLVHAGNPPSPGRRSRWMSRYVLWPLAACGAKVACCSQYVRDEYRGIPGIPRHILHAVWNCVRAGTISARAEKARATRQAEAVRYGIMVATLERHKDHDTLLAAMPEVIRRHPEFRLRLAGDGTLREQLISRARELDCSRAVEWLGTRTDVPELLGRSDLFVFATTHQEGLGSVLFEALAAGLPVVASDVPACWEALGGGRWGRLVTPANPAALADGICASLEMPPDDNYRRAAAAYALSFGAERMMAKYLALAFRGGLS